MASITLSIRSEVICPILRKTICLSIVKTRSGRTYEFVCNEPDIKSSDINGCANISFIGLDVIWQMIMSSPLRSVRTNAGRLLFPDKSENGKGTTTTSPFTNLSMPPPPLVLTSLLPKRFRLQDRFLSSFRSTPQPDLQVDAPNSIAIVRCFLICFLL